MSSVPAGKRQWNCPDCGGEVLLSITQLDPLACPECLTRLKGGASEQRGHGSAAGNATSLLQSLPEIVRLVGVGLLSLLLGLLIGFVAGRVTAPKLTPTTATSPAKPDSTDRNVDSDADVVESDEEARPGYRWVKGYTRKDGVKVKGHWARDPNHRE